MSSISDKLNTKNFDISQINEKMTANPTDYISECEKSFKDCLKNITEEIAAKSDCKIIMLAGPSGSGKTTTANLIADYLKNYNLNATVLSIDDFYLPGDKAPTNSEGKRDYETVHAIDIPLVRQCLTKLLTTGECMIPKYLFGPGERIENHTRVTLGKGDITIIEGLHALNPLFTDGLGLDGILKIYISPAGSFMLNGEQIINEKNIRLIRRMVRDFKFRGASPELTLSMWNDVVDGESKFIEPFIGDSDYKINTLHGYEINVLGNNAKKLLETVTKDSPYYSDADRLLKSLEHMHFADDKLVPFESLLREFLGDGQYN